MLPKTKTPAGFPINSTVIIKPSPPSPLLLLPTPSEAEPLQDEKSFRMPGAPESEIRLPDYYSYIFPVNLSNF